MRKRPVASGAAPSRSQYKPKLTSTAGATGEDPSAMPDWEGARPAVLVVSEAGAVRPSTRVCSAMSTGPPSALADQRLKVYVVNDQSRVTQT